LDNKSIPEGVGVSHYGTIRLGNDVVVDGLDHSRKSRIRVQTHAHKDHTYGWIKHIKPGRALLATEPTVRILSLENKNVNINGNIHISLHGEIKEATRLIQSNHLINHNLDTGNLSLFDANHMTGSSQVLYENTSKGYSALYSGDIGWPIQEIPKSEILILDTTYSNLESSRDKDYTREDAINKLLGLISSNLSRKPIYIYARYGMMQELIEKILENINTKINFVASEDLIKKTEIMAGFRSSLPQIINYGEFNHNLTNVIHLKDFHKKQNETLPGINLTITNFRSQNELKNTPDEITGEYQNYNIPVTNHANGTELYEYIDRVNPQIVITDSYRNNPSSVKLSESIKKKFNILSVPSSELSTWKL
tara:strand:+ start:4574 stop:5671 length:1098 start_codon:yes stop_codon:yes gene_type:complete